MAEVPTMGAVTKATVKSWRDGWAQMNNSPRWPGRGLAIELGVRAWGCLTRDVYRSWPQSLIDHERMLDDFKENADG